MIRRPPRSTRTDTLFPTRRSSDLTKGGLSSKLHAVSDGKGRPPILPLSEGQMSHYKGSADDRCLAQRQSLLGDRGYDTDWFRDALARRGIAASIPPKANRQVPIFSSEERRVGKECVRTCRSRGWPAH